MRACLLACLCGGLLQCSATPAQVLCVPAVVVHKECVNMCVRQPLTLCSFHSKLIWLLTRLDGKGPGARSAHCISRWESPLCCHHTAFLLTGHAQRATPHATPPFPPRACLNQSVGGGSGAFAFFSHLTFKASHEDSGVDGEEEGRRASFFLKALWVAELICHSLFPLTGFALL